MIARVLAFSVNQRWLIVIVTLLAAAFGGYSLTKLPIDAVPDITNNQVQINTLAPSLSPYEIEKQVTFPIETALAGIPGLENTRSVSFDGLSQVTAIFTERTDIYFARQQVTERLTEAKAALPPGATVRLGPIAYSDRSGRAFRFEAGHRSDVKPATIPDLKAARCGGGPAGRG